MPKDLSSVKSSITIEAPPKGVSKPWPQGAKYTAMASGAFCLLMSLLLMINHFQSRAVDPLSSTGLTALKVSLAQNPGDEKIKQEIRVLDLRLRQEFNRRLALGDQARWLLFGGMAVFLLAIKSATYRNKMPRPPKKIITPEMESRSATQARWAVGLLGTGVGISAWVLSLHSETNLAGLAKPSGAPVETASPATPEPPPPSTPFPSADEIKANWPRFRGPSGSGVANFTNLPPTWNVATGEGILWKAVVPISGPHSPILWGNRLFLAGANARKREVYCYEAATGKLLWQKPVEAPAGTNSEPPTVMEDSGGYVPATPATDGRRVYAIYATGDVGALDFKGNQVWAVNLGRPDNSYGHSTSLELYQNRLIIQYDQGTGKDGKSKVLALDTLTGQVVWQSPIRPVPNSWSTPILVHTGQRDLIITCANPWVMAYEPEKGTEIWRSKSMYGEVTPSPIFANGLVLTAIEGEKLSAIRPDGAGDVTKTHVVWTAEDGLPEICSPLSDGKYVYLLTSSGLLTCYDLQNGKKKYEHDFELSFKSSPGLCGDRIYLFSDKGVAIQVQAGPEFKELARSEMGQEIMSSPAFADGRLYIRAKQHLFCIGAKK